MFLKIGEQFMVSPADIKTAETVFNDPEIFNRFEKFAKDLKKIAPKASDFIYFSCIMLHASEASLINVDGSPKLDKKGHPVTVQWEKRANGGTKWVCSDPSIYPYANNNRDSFPEEELVKAHKLWISRPLCINHISNDVEGIRGIILDTVYDYKHKRVIGLCALDAKTYPDLARKVSTGYACSVSMGTACGACECFDCGTVAQSERDFCTHMRSKTARCEINRKLNPIELSLVSSPADPGAKVRTIFAAAQNLKNRQYSENTNEKIKQLQYDLWQANEKLTDLKAIASEQLEAEKNLLEEKQAHQQEQQQDEDNNISEQIIEPPYGQSSGRYAEVEDSTDPNSFSLNQSPRYADINALVSELKVLKASLESSLKFLTQPNKEDIMSDQSKDMNKIEAYWLGGGGVNEPAPHKVKYPIDPLQDQLRVKEDRQMVGQAPFPGVGDVEGLHPSPESVDEKDELERKKMLRRAEQEQRELRRKEALDRAKANLEKSSYWLGGGGVNEPTPGKVKYPIDPTADKVRAEEDRQMVGQKPFPDVGDVEGLHPSPESVDEKDELERKKKLSRASLVAKFHRAANLNGTDNLDESGWRIYSKDEGGEKLVFAASVKELSGNRSEALFDMIATKDFGSKMLEKIRSVGLTKAASLFKSAQAVAEQGVPGQTQDAGGMGPVPAMPGGDPSAAAAPPAEDMGTQQDEGGKGDPKDAAVALAEKVRDDASDLLEAVRLLTGEQAEMGELEKGISALPKAAHDDLRQAAEWRRELHQLHLSAAKKSLAELKNHYDELKLIAELADPELTKNASLRNMVKTAFTQAQKARQEAHLTLRSYARYVSGCEELEGRVKAASEEMEPSESTGEPTDMAMNNDQPTPTNDTNEADDLNLHDFEEELSDEESPMHLDPEEEEEMMMEEEEPHKMHHDEEEMMVDDVNLMDNAGTMVQLPPGQPVPPGAKAVEMKQASFDLTTKEGRANYRAKLAKDMGEVEDVAKLKWNPLLQEANSLTNGQTKLDTKPSDELGLVETLPEIQKKVLEVARMAPRVRKEAETLNDLIVKGAVKKDELDQLIAEGLDSEVVKYWREFYSQGDKPSSEFGKMLTTETMQAKAQEEIQTYKVKLARAYDLANEMVRRGLIADTQTAIAHQVEETMKWNDDAFESMKRVVAKHNPAALRKEASMPQVGLIGSGEPFNSNGSSGDLDFQAELDRAFAGRKY